MGEPLRPEDPRILGRFQLLERLGEGGQGIVYLGADTADGQHVAVKVLKSADHEARARLEREMNAVQRVRRRFCIARVIDFSFEGDRPFVVSEYVEGPSLYDRVRDGGPLRDGALERLMVNTATALMAIHGSHVVHRDLKPANVLLGPDGPRVVDFGIARPVDQHTVSGQLVGTPSYFAPEQLRGQKATQASDVWAWACTMVFAATGYPPFGPFAEDGGNLAVILGRIMNAPPRLGSALDEWRPLILRCLDQDPARRPTAREVHTLLLESDVEPPPPAEPEAPRQPGGHEPSRDVTQLPPADQTSRDQPRPYFLDLPETVPPRGQDTLPPPVPTPPPFPAPGPWVPPGPPARRSRAVPVVAALVLVAVLGGGGWYLVGRNAGGGGGDGLPETFAGTWAGTLTRSGGPLQTGSLDTRLILYKGGSEGEIQFDGDTLCNGTVNVASASDTRVRLDISIKTGCPDGTLTLTPSGGALSAQLYSSDASTGNGTLRK